MLLHYGTFSILLFLFFRRDYAYAYFAGGVSRFHVHPAPPLKHISMSVMPGWEQQASVKRHVGRGHEEHPAAGLPLSIPALLSLKDGFIEIPAFEGGMARDHLVEDAPGAQRSVL
jgi:hypothetical protein